MSQEQQSLWMQHYFFLVTDETLETQTLNWTPDFPGTFQPWTEPVYFFCPHFLGLNLIIHVCTLIDYVWTWLLSLLNPLVVVWTWGALSGFYAWTGWLQALVSLNQYINYLPAWADGKCLCLGVEFCYLWGLHYLYWGCPDGSSSWMYAQDGCPPIL